MLNANPNIVYEFCIKLISVFYQLLLLAQTILKQRRINIRLLLGLLLRHRFAAISNNAFSQI